MRRQAEAGSSGKLRIGDDWNAITIIALAQTNPLKAVAEFVENSIDAHAKSVTITRGKEGKQHYLRIVDDGDGIPLNDGGLPDFKYVATHICDSIKRRMREQGVEGIQGEFGIGLLSFWTLGEALTLISSGADGRSYQMQMRKGDPSYAVVPKRTLFGGKGTELKVKPLLAGIRQFSGEKIQWYLASELRDRIRTSGVQIRIIDRQARAEFSVEPRQFSGRLLHQLPAASAPQGDIYAELYLAEPSPTNEVSLCRSGTRVLQKITELDAFQRSPWNSEYLQGILDAPFLTITPGTRLGVVLDDAFAALCGALQPLEQRLQEIVEEQRRAEEEKASQDTLRSIQKAFREALLSLPAEEYDWFPGRRTSGPHRPSSSPQEAEGGDAGLPEMVAETADGTPQQKEFFQFAGPLFRVQIVPASSIVPVGGSRNLRAACRDRRGRTVDDGLNFHWEIFEGAGTLGNPDREIARFAAPTEPGLTRVRVNVLQGDIACTAEGLVTVTDSLLPEKKGAPEQQGLPGYTYQKAPGELWRSRYSAEQNVIVINNGHRDFVFASRNKSLKLRYICKLYAKELVYRNFPGYSPDQLLERMIELLLYAEEHLR